ADGTSRFGRLRPPQGEGFSPPPHPRTAMVEQLDEKGPTGSVPVGQSVYAGLNLIGTQRVAGRGQQTRRIVNPADTEELVDAVHEASPEVVEEVCAVAARAFPAWQVTPPPDRARVLFRYRELLEEHFDEVAGLIVRENGKLLSEARGSLRRGVDVVEFACGIP